MIFQQYLTVTSGQQQLKTFSTCSSF